MGMVFSLSWPYLRFLNESARAEHNSFKSATGLQTIPRMAAKRKIAILLHEKDSYPKSRGHFIWSLCDIWRERGIEIAVLKGVGKYIEADLLIPHVDATILPPAYENFFRKYPRVVNVQLHDISKRFISRNLLS